MNDKELYIFKATCTNVVDGDTADFVIDVGFKLTTEQRVRFLYVNTPEKRTKDPLEKEAALKAQEFVEGMILNKDVFIRTYESDAFGRYLGEIFVESEDGSVSVNQLLLLHGYAEPYI